MLKRNNHLAKLQSGYLFPEIQKRKRAFLQENPHADLISLGIGDTTEPISQYIVDGFLQAATHLGSAETYSGYGAEQGDLSLRKKIAEEYYQNRVSAEEVFISDGTKCDIGRLQLLLGAKCKIGVQDPSYPAYVDTSVVVGQTGPFSEGGYEGIVYLKCYPENDFFPNLHTIPPLDALYFCSPNNPTGAAATYEQLASLVAYAKETQVLIIYDAAYTCFIRDESLPKSIYEIPHAKEVAIELNSLSKMAGFTGVRLGFSVVPKTLQYADGESIHQDWLRIATTFFNGASNIAQAGAKRAFDPQGMQEIRRHTDLYLKNAHLLRSCFKSLGFPTYGGENAPYVWVQFPGYDSWGIFTELLEKTHIIATPGCGFGPAGEGFLRFSAFGKQADVTQAIGRLKSHFSYINSLSCHSCN